MIINRKYASPCRDSRIVKGGLSHSWPQCNQGWVSGCFHRKVLRLHLNFYSVDIDLRESVLSIKF